MNMSEHERCPICNKLSPLKFQENIDRQRFNPTTYGSRKAPELMHYEMFECQNCDFLFSVSGPNSEELRRLYFASDFDSPREAKLAALTYWREISSRRLDHSSTLDVGTGEGSFLSLCVMHGSTKVRGLEPSRAARDRAPESVREMIVLGSFEQEQASPVYSLVTLFQTIEHLRNPGDFLDFARDSLIEGGTVAIACHDYRYPLNRILGKKSPIFDIEHLQLFSRKSVSRLILQAGFRNVSVRRYWNRYPVSYLLKLSPFGTRLSQILSNSNSAWLRLAIPVMLGNLFVTGTK